MEASRDGNFWIVNFTTFKIVGQIINKSAFTLKEKVNDQVKKSAKLKLTATSLSNYYAVLFIHRHNFKSTKIAIKLSFST